MDNFLTQTAQGIVNGGAAIANKIDPLFLGPLIQSQVQKLQPTSPVPQNQNLQDPDTRQLAQYNNDTNRSPFAPITPGVTPQPPGPQIQNKPQVMAQQTGPQIGSGQPAVSPTPTQQPNPFQGIIPQEHAQAQSILPDQLTQQIQQGFQKWGGASVPAATLSASFARAGQGLPDPLMPAVLAIKETGGGKHLADTNNLLNIQYNGIGNSPYEKPEYGIEGGGGHGGFPKVINNGMYKDYLKSGNLADFFKVYTPTYDKNGKQINAPIDKQIAAYNAIRSNFLQ
jgi:hypothetical protein